MKYISTRGQVAPVEFQDAVMMGLADDGGLIIPQSIPDVSDRIDSWRDMSYCELAFEVLSLFATDIPADDLKQLIEKAYGNTFDVDVAPTVSIGDINVLELWHGPTMSFKDVALQLLGNLFEYILARKGGRLNILAATSGDTGSAAICGVRGRAGIDIFVMHPAGKVSPIQQRQMTTVLDANVHNIAIEGSFDDCQGIMKTLAGDLDFKRKYSLGAVNSVNWARVLAQTVYYFYSAFAVQKATGAASVRFCVPTGNFGDVLAGWYAKQMGLNISQFILATNENDILSRFFQSGEYSRGQVHHTIAPAMDIQVASNFERYLYYKIGSDGDALRGLMEGFAENGSLSVASAADGAVDPLFISQAGTRQQCLAAIGKYYEQYEYVLDPHTAVGVAVAESVGLAGDPVVCLSTAHPAKFPAAIEEATGKDVAHHPAIDGLSELEERCVELPDSIEAVREFVIKTVG